MALLAANAALAAFRVLVDTSAAADVDAELREAVEPRATAEAPRPDPPRLLPAVHVLWAPLMSALRVGAVKFHGSSVEWLWSAWPCPLHHIYCNCCRLHMHSVHCAVMWHSACLGCD